MTTFVEASTAGTVEEFRDELLESLEEEGSTVSGWSDGAPQRAFVEGEARAITAQSQITADLAATASPGTCSRAGSTWVDAVMGWFSVENSDGSTGRLRATQAIWEIPLVVTPAAAPLTINAGNAGDIQLQAQNGAIFQCTQESTVELSAAGNYRGTARFTARLAGITGNATPGQITKVVSGPAGLEVDLSAIQRRTLTARADETDALFIARGLGQWARLGAGWTLPAYDYLIPFYGNTATTSVTRWSVDEANPLGPGTARVWLADAAGPASAGTVTAVSAGLNGTDVKPVGSVTTTVSPSTANPLTLNIILGIDGTNAEVVANATAALAVLASVFPLGPARLEADLVSAIVRGSPIKQATVFLSGSRSVVIDLDLPGFLSVIEVTDTGIVGFAETLAPGEVLSLTINITTVTS